MSASTPVVELDAPAGQVLIDAHNERVKLIDWHPGDFDGLKRVLELAESAGAPVSKAMVYARPEEVAGWEALGFHREALIEGYFDGTHTAICSRFLEPWRARPRTEEHADVALEIAMSKEASVSGLPAGVTSRPAAPADARTLMTLMEPAFRQYPTPVNEHYVAGRLRRRESWFRLAFDGSSPIACCSAEIDAEHRIAEISDCVTDPRHRGRGIMAALIAEVERDVHAEFGYRHVYSLARAAEVGMNSAFARGGYGFTGRLVNNCRMPSGWESIHVWCKPLGD